MAHRRLAAGLLISALTLSACASDELIQPLRADLASIDRQVTTLGQRLEQAEQARAGERTAERITQAQQGQADLAARLEALSAQVRAIKGQTDTTEHHIDRLQTHVKEAGDRLSRVEFSTAQAAMMAQQAASTSQLTAQSAQTALQSMAEQINAALGGPPASQARPPGGQTSQRSDGAGSPPTDRTTRPVPPTALTTAPAAPTPPAQDPLPDNGPARMNRGLRTITPRETTTATASPSGNGAPVQSDAETAYRLALTAFTHQRYGEAVAGFLALMDHYPNSLLTTLGLYWLGEAHYALQAYAEAAEAFRRFLAAQPSGPRTPPALLKLGLIAQAGGNVTEAKERFTTLTRQHSASHEATVARGLLAGLP